MSSVHGAGGKNSLGSAAVEFTKVLYALSPCLGKVTPRVLSSDPHPHLPSYNNPPVPSTEKVPHCVQCEQNSNT